MDSHWEIIVIGSGIAGHSAAIYTSREDNETLVLHGDEPGGQLTLTSEVANYPGFPENVGGVELVNNMQEQAENFGAEYEHGIVEEVSKRNDGMFEVILNSGKTYKSEAVIAASGASAKTLGIPGESELMGNGVSTCATCDGAFFRGEDMIVVGGGDAACEEAVFLTKFAETVYLVHRREDFRAESHLVNEVKELAEEGDIELVLNSEVTNICGEEQLGVETATIVTHSEGYPTEKPDSEITKRTLDIGAVFIAIGHLPNTQYLEKTDIELDSTGYVKTNTTEGRGQTETGVPGLFAAGDVVDYHYQQAATASGMGVKAAIDANNYLS